MWVDYLVPRMQATIVCPPLYSLYCRPFSPNKAVVFLNFCEKALALLYILPIMGVYTVDILLKGMCSRYSSPMLFISLSVKVLACS